LVLRDGDEGDLVALTRASSVRAGLAQRARIVLLASQGVSNTKIAELVGVSRPTVIGWRDRYGERGLAGLDDEPRAGPTADGRSSRHCGGDVEATAEEVRRDALVVSAAGPASGDRGCHGGQGVA
jgi:hypothetical protein